MSLLFPVLLLLLGPSCEAGRRGSDPVWSGACPVVEEAEPLPVELDSQDWLVMSEGQLLSHNDDGLSVWEPQDGAKPRVLKAEDTWPSWMWVGGVPGELVNLHTGQGVSIVGGESRPDVLPEADRLDSLDLIGDGPGWRVWAQYDSQIVRLHRDGAISTAQWPDEENRADAAALLPDGGLVLGGEELLVVYDPPLNELRRLPGPPIATRSVAASPDGRSLAVVGYSGMVNLVDFETGVARWSFPTERHGISFSPDGRHVLSTGYQGADVIAVDTGCLVLALPARGDASWVSETEVAWVGADGRLVLSEVPR